MNDETFQSPNHHEDLHGDATIAPLSSPAKNKEDQHDISAVLDLLEDNGTSSTKNVGERAGKTAKSTYDRIGTKIDKKDPINAQKQLTFSDDSDSSSSSSLSSHANKSSKRPGSSVLSRDTIAQKRELRKSITSDSHRSGTAVIEKRSSHLTHGESLSPSNMSNFNYNVNYRFSVFRPAGSGPLIIPQTPKKKNERMTIFSLLDVARRLGILKKSFAYSQFISRDQFLMVKDVSTGKFDMVDEKRFQQLDKLKRKILFASGAPQKKHSRRRRTLLWDAEDMPTFKTLYRDIIKKLKQVLTPNHKLRMLWDFFLTLLMFYDLVITPLELTFDIPFINKLYDFTILVDVCFILDILLNFNTGYYAKGLLVMDRKKIAWHYAEGWFLFDLIPAFPYAYIFPDDTDYSDMGLEGIRIGGFPKIIKVVRLLRVFKLRWYFQKLESYIDFTAMVAGIVGFLKLSFIILLIAHCLACIFHFTSVFEMRVHTDAWLIKAGLADSPWFERYVTSVYWATMTMITVGYGDITPGTVNEKILAIMAMLVASVVFAYTMNRINVILAGLDDTSEQYKRALATISDYMKKKRVDKELQIKIKKYLEYALAVETSLDMNEANLDAFLNQSLKDELITQIYGKILLDKVVFKQFTSDFISRAALIMKEKIYSPEDVIFLEYKHKDTHFYCINTGKVEMFHFYSSSYLKTLSKGSFFGEVSFFTGKHFGISARSVDFSTIYFLKREEFLVLLDDFPLEREKFHCVKDKIKLYKDYSPLDSKCYSCGQMNHSVTTCPRIHLSVDKPKYIEAYLEAKSKFYKEFIRTRKRTLKGTNYCNHLEEASKKVQQKIEAGGYMNLTPKIKDFTREKYRDPTQFMALQPVLPFFAQERPKPDAALHIGSSILPMSQGEGDEQIQIKYEIAKAAAPKRFSLIFTPMVDEQKGFAQKSIVLGADVMENDIDSVQNYTYYFPHNNFSTLFPQSMLHAKTTLFDFANQISTPKTTLKKFVNIMRNRLSVKKNKLGTIAGKSRLEILKPKNNIIAQSLFPRELRKLSDHGLRPKVREPRKSVLVAYAMGDDADNSGEGGYETDS